MNYHLAHTTTYEYSGSVSLSHHLVRLQPRQLPHQHCLGNRLEIHPPPSVVQSRLDYFGNQMTFVTVEGSHRNLVVVSRSEVEIEASPTPAPEKTPAWETVAELCAAEKPNGVVGEREFTYASPHIKRQEDFADYARPAFTPQRPLLEAVLDLTGSIHRDFKFDSKSTTVATPLEEVFKSRRGVCQDFAHLLTALALREKRDRGVSFKVDSEKNSGYAKT